MQRFVRQTGTPSLLDQVEKRRSQDRRDAIRGENLHGCRDAAKIDKTRLAALTT